MFSQTTLFKTKRKITGGTITVNGSNVIHAVSGLAGGTLVVPINFLSPVNYLAVGGGGAGGISMGGGGGAGGFLSGTMTLATASYPVVIGSGATASNTSGTATTFNGLTLVGGGRGGSENTPVGAGGAGGSGGGGTFNVSYKAGGAGTVNQGYSGATYTAVSGSFYGAGGGGAGSVGIGNMPGNGGAGISSSITGSPLFYAGGGGGGGAFNLTGDKAGTGGSSVGGNGGNNNLEAGYDAVADRGSGGGGGGRLAQAGKGSNGVVIISYIPIAT